MSDIREKLIDLLLDIGAECSSIYRAAGYLLANGVTIPVRCGRCKHYSSGRCNNYHGLYGRPKETDFCSYGEVKD